MTSVLGQECNSGGSSDCSISLLPCMSFKDKCSRNKRKFRADPPQVYENRVLSTVQNDHTDYDLPPAQVDTSINSNGKHGSCDMCSVNHDISSILKLDLGLPTVGGQSEDHARDGVEAGEFQDVYWTDDTEGELEDLVLSTLDVIFRTAVQKIVACGYTEEAAVAAVMCPGICYGSKDTMSNVLENALLNLRGGCDVDLSKDHYFDSLLGLEKYVLAELVCVLRELIPFFSTGDALWHLLMCDMNVSHACEIMEGDPLGRLSFNRFSNGSSKASQIPHQKHEQNPKLTSPQNHKVKPKVMDSDSGFQKQDNCLSLGVPNFSNSNGPLFNVKDSEIECSIPSTVNENNFFGVSGVLHRSHGEKAGNGRRNHPNNAKRESILRHKGLHSERSNRTHVAKGASRSVKFGGLNGMNLDKKLKRVSDFPTANIKDFTLKINKSSGNNRNRSFKTASIREGLSLPVGLNNESVDPVSLLPSSPSTPPSLNGKSESDIHGLPCTETELSLSIPSEDYVSSDAAETSNHTLSSLMGENLTGMCKDDVILGLVANVQELENQLEEWTEWVNEKVMQTARRLGKDKAEFKALRQEKEEVERLKREKHTLEESTMKKLSEMDSALCKASEQVDQANSSVLRLEAENDTLRQEMESMKLQAAEAAANCRTASLREKKTAMKSQSREKQRTLLQEELLAEKKKLSMLNLELQQARDLYNQLEERWKKERRGKEEVLAEAGSARREREKAEVSWKSKEGMMKVKAENSWLRVKAEVRSLEKEISRLRLKADSSKIAALRSGAAALGGAHTPGGGDPRPAPAHGPAEGGGGLRRERECVMCLSEEMSVVFLPCAHQVLCSACDQLHEKQGMKDCPSCRSPVVRRIPVRYARP